MEGTTLKIYTKDGTVVPFVLGIMGREGIDRMIRNILKDGYTHSYDNNFVGIPPTNISIVRVTNNEGEEVNNE